MCVQIERGGEEGDRLLISGKSCTHPQFVANIRFRVKNGFLISNTKGIKNATQLINSESEREHEKS
jgi:hypothetical protein